MAKRVLPIDRERRNRVVRTPKVRGPRERTWRALRSMVRGDIREDLPPHLRRHDALPADSVECRAVFEDLPPLGLRAIIRCSAAFIKARGG